MILERSQTIVIILDKLLLKISRGFALACPPPNPDEALPAWFLIRGGLVWHVHRWSTFSLISSSGGLPWHVHLQTRQTRQTTFSLISFSRGFGLACPPSQAGNPAKACTSIIFTESPLKHFQFASFFQEVWNSSYLPRFWKRLRPIYV